MKSSLLIGCGNAREKVLGFGPDEGWGELVTLDIDPDTGCSVVHDLNELPYPFRDEQFDEIAAYEVLEHCGTQGDWRFFFGQFAEFYRILKPGGFVFATVPSMQGPWVWGDPGHTRALPIQCFCFLSQDHYAQVGQTACTDYRPYWKGDFQLVDHTDDGLSLRLALRKVVK